MHLAATSSAGDTPLGHSGPRPRCCLEVHKARERSAPHELDVGGPTTAPLHFSTSYGRSRRKRPRPTLRMSPQLVSSQLMTPHKATCPSRPVSLPGRLVWYFRMQSAPSSADPPPSQLSLELKCQALEARDDMLLTHRRRTPICRRCPRRDGVARAVTGRGGAGRRGGAFDPRRWLIRGGERGAIAGTERCATRTRRARCPLFSKVHRLDCIVRAPDTSHRAGLKRVRCEGLSTGAFEDSGPGEVGYKP